MIDLKIFRQLKIHGGQKNMYKSGTKEVKVWLQSDIHSDPE